MRLSSFVFALALFLFSAAVPFAEETRVRIAPPAAWLGPIASLDLSGAAPEKIPSGFYYQLFERRQHAENAESFTRIAYRLTTPSALQDGARISVDYDPAYETIDFHFLRVIRNGNPVERLSLSEIKTLQQERDLDRHLYNGQFTALVLLDDVRVGDTVDYAYTRRGRNPIFDGRFHDVVPVRWGTPLQKLVVGVLHRASRPFFHKLHGEAPLVAEVVARDDDLIEHRWSAENLTAITVDSEIPAWFSPYAFLQFTEYATWGAVEKWARPLYARPEKLPPELERKVDELTAAARTPEEKALAVLNFVQREIRYLGIELGPKSHRPSPPDQVFNRRFGDCKDKSLLLCALLEHAGVPAVPALTHSHHRHTIRDWLPSPDAFDHAIARIGLSDNGFILPPPQVSGTDIMNQPSLPGETHFWVDPTISEQTGRLANRALPNYCFALPIDAASPGELAAIKVLPGAKSALRIQEHYDVSSFDAPAKLEVISRYSGSGADAMRDYLQRTPLDEIGKNLLNSRTRLHPQLLPDGAPTWTDDPALNTVTLVHRYTLPDMWKKDEKSSVLRAEVYPAILRDYTEPPDSLKRTMPLALPHPLRVAWEATLRLPHPWPKAKNETRFDDPAFEARVESESQNSTVRISYIWQTLSDRVEPTRVAEYAAKLRSFRDELGYSLSYDPEIARRQAQFRLHWPLVLNLVGTLGALAGAIWWLRRHLAQQPRDDSPPPLPGSLSGLGGWLVLVGFGIVFRPINQLALYVRNYRPFFDARTVEGLTTPGEANYLENFGWILQIESAAATLLTASSFVMAFLFFSKSRFFPRVFIIWMSGALGWTICDIALVRTFIKSTADSAEDTKQLLQLVAGCAVWIPYMLASRRVRQTFVR